LQWEFGLQAKGEQVHNWVFTPRCGYDEIVRFAQDDNGISLEMMAGEPEAGFPARPAHAECRVLLGDLAA
jgi:hypothetical protein